MAETSICMFDWIKLEMSEITFKVKFLAQPKAEDSAKTCLKCNKLKVVIPYMCKESVSMILIHMYAHT